MDLLKDILGIGQNIGNFLKNRAKDVGNAIQTYIPQQQVRSPIPQPQKQSFQFSLPKVNFQMPKIGGVDLVKTFQYYSGNAPRNPQIEAANRNAMFNPANMAKNYQTYQRQAGTSTPLQTLIAATKQSANSLPQNFPAYVRNVSQQAFGKTAGNIIAAPTANTGQAIAQGAKDIYRGGKQLVTIPELIRQKKYGQAAQTGLEGGAKIFFGGAKNIAAATPLFQVFNVMSGMDNKAGEFSRAIAGGMAGGERFDPNAKRTKVNVLGMNIEPIEGVGQMIGFVKNPAWQKIYPLTSQILKVNPTASKAANFIFQRVTKGGLEGYIQALSQMPENPTDDQKWDYIRNNVLLGAGAELGFDTLGKGVDSLKNKQTIVRLMDTIANEYRRANIPVYDAISGKRMPMWQYRLRDQSGAIDLNAEIQNPLKGLGEDVPQNYTPIRNIEELIKKTKESATGGQPTTPLSAGEPGRGLPTEGAMKPRTARTAEEIIQQVQTGTYTPLKNTTEWAGSTGSVPPGNKPPGAGAPPNPEIPNTKLKIDPQEINVNRLDLTDAQKAEVKQIGVKEVKDRLSNEQIQDLAKKAGIDTKTYTTDQTAQKIAEQLNARRQVVEAEQALTALRQNGGTPQEIEAAIRKVADASKVSASQGTDIARQLQARRILANEIDTPMQKIFKLLDNAGVNPDVYIKRAVDVDFNDANQVATFYREMVPPKFSDWIDQVRYNSMLSSPNTHINNAFSNLIGSSVVAPVERTLRGTVDFLQSAVTGKEREYFAGEGLAYTKGYWSNVGKAAHRFADVMRGVKENTNLDMRDVPLAETGTKGKIAKALSVPMKLLEASDQFFTALTKGGEEAALTYRGSKGVDVGDIADEAERLAAYRLYRQELKDPRQGAVLDAVDEITGKLMALRNSKNNIVRTFANFTIPFVKTPMNIFKQGIEYSPAGVLTMKGAADPAGQLVKAAMGTAGVMGALTMLGSGRLTWAQPTSEKEKQAFLAAGMQPYSVKIGDKWVAYSKLPPVMSFNLALVAAIDDALNKKDITEGDASAIMEGIAKFGNFFADQSYVKNIGDAISAVKGDTESVSRFISNYPQQLVPYRALGGWLARLTDPLQRQTPKDASFWEKQVYELMKNIPGLSQAVPAREDANGLPMENQNRVLNAFSPLRVTTERPVEKATYDTIVEQNKAKRDLKNLKASAKSDLEKQGILTKNGKATVTSLDPKIEASLDAIYDVKGLDAMPEETNYQKAKKVSAAKALIDKVLADDAVDEETRMNYVAAKTGLPREDIEYYSISKGSTEEKYAYILDGIAAMQQSGGDITEFLKEGRRDVMGNMILANGVIDDLVSNGYISKALGTQLKKYTYTKDGGYMAGGGSGKGGGLTKTQKNKLESLFKKSQEIDYGSLPKIEGAGKEGKPSKGDYPYQKVPQLDLRAAEQKPIKLPNNTPPKVEDLIRAVQAGTKVGGIAKAKEIIAKARQRGGTAKGAKLSRSFFRGGRNS